MANFQSFKSTTNPLSVRRPLINQRILVDGNDTPVGFQTTGNGPDGIWGATYLSAGQIAAPTAPMIADLNARYQLNVAPYTCYRSDGTTLQMMPSAGDTPTFVGMNTKAGATIAPIAAAFFNVRAPESQAATIGLGINATPFSNADNTAGIQTIINGFATTGGAVQLGGGAYAAPTSINITTAGVAISGTSPGFNVDPNGSVEGTSGSRITTAAAAPGISIGASVGRIFTVKLNGLYLYGGGTTSDGSSGIKISGSAQGLQGGMIEDVSISNVNYGLLVDAQMDATLVSNLCSLYCGYGLLAPAGMGGMPNVQIFAADLSDNMHGGHTDLSGAGGPINIAGLYWRNANVLTTNGANVTVGSNQGVYVGTYAANPGLNFLTSGQVAADNYYVSGSLNLFLGCKASGAPSGNSGWHLTGASSYNVFVAPIGAFNGQDFLIDSGALENVIFSPAPITIVNNSGQIQYLDYLDNATRVRHVSNGGTPVLSFDAQGNEGFGVFVALDATALANGRKFYVGSTGAGAQISGAGYFGIIDESAAGRLDMSIDQFGVVRFPASDVVISSGAALVTNASAGFLYLPATNGTPTGTPSNAAADKVPFTVNVSSKTIDFFVSGVGWYHVAGVAGAA